jgi:type VI secretion system secreted protein VgrG
MRIARSSRANTPCPVVTSKHADTTHPRPLNHREWLCAIGMGENSKRVLRYARRASVEARANLRIIHAIQAADSGVPALLDVEEQIQSEERQQVRERMGKRVTLDMQVTDTGTKRYFNGIVASLEATGGDTFFNSYRVRLVPTLWLLSLNKQTRVFQDKSVLEIVKAVLSPYSIVPTVETQGTFTSLEYCTQYRETDLAFVSRLLQQHGIFYYFTHTASDHVMVLSDTVTHLTECAVASQFRYGITVEEQLSFYEPVIYSFASRSSLITGEHSTWDYRLIPYAASHASPDGEGFDHDG